MSGLAERTRQKGPLSGATALYPIARSLRDALLFLGLLLCVGGIGATDAVTGPHVSFALFYAVPVAIGGWYLGGSAALLLSIAAGLELYVGDLALRKDALTAGYLWSVVVRLLFVAVIGQLLARVRTDRDRLARLLSLEASARQETVEQLRHRDRLALVGQVASGIAHEVGTPLNVIAGRARLITESDTALNEAREHARAVLDQSERVAKTIRQLLDFARRRGPQHAHVNLHDLAWRVIDLLRPLAAKRQIELLLLSSCGAPIAAVDATQIEQALSNLILNALQAVQERGTVTVCIDVFTKASVHLPKETPALEHLALSVQDDGSGIAPENLRRIFEPFFSTRRAGEGTGLGLSITDEIVRDHGGFIEVDSEVWRGSRFTIYLPRVKEGT